MVVEGGASPRNRIRIWFTRGAFGLVFAWNVLCALQFTIDPASYTAAYQLEGPGATAAVRGLGVAFLMWNATYPLFIWRPRRYRVLGVVIVVQQVVGLAGELCILLLLPTGMDVLQAGILRFIAFDAAGLVLMAAAIIAFAQTPRASHGDPGL